MKKIVLALLITCLTYVFFIGATILNVTIISKETNEIMGATHERVQRELNVSGVNVLQTYHYLGADFQTADFRVITGDDYTSTGYRPATTIKHAENSQQVYDYDLIIGGVNADFFESYGTPQEAYIENGQVISSGIGYANREVIGFKENGDVVFGKPVFEGYEVVVRDPNGRERIRLPLENVNTPYVSSSIDIYAYFDTYNSTLPEGVYKYIAQVSETKGALPKLFGRGVVTDIKFSNAMTVSDGTIVLVSKNTYLQNIVELGDTMIVQRKMIGDFAGVNWAVGAYGKLVSNGEKVTNIIGIDPTLRHPRTAVGVKNDGSVFFIAMDGRQTGYSQGATLYEMADLMLSYGAVTAYNFDGGGSTTMALRQSNDTFSVVNEPSDGSPRLVTNSLFLAVRTNFDNVTPYPIPDYSIRLSQPTNLSVDKGILTFDKNSDTSTYEVFINNETYTINTNRLDLKTIIDTVGTYNINVVAKGDGIFYKDSFISTTYTYQYDGPQILNTPSNLNVSSTGILTWDEVLSADGYLFIVDEKTYTIFINRFNLTTLSLEPGTYNFQVISKGDGYNTTDSLPQIYTYRVYSDEEKAILEQISLILEILYQRNKD
jgi:hypothetical protein